MSHFSTLPPGKLNVQPARVVPFPGRVPERLVGYDFRCWLSGFVTGDISSWEDAWTAYHAAVGDCTAKPLILRLSQFVRAVKSNAEREIECYPASCRGFCRDECLAISMIAASQHDARTALCSCASALTGWHDIGDAIDSAQVFAAELKNANQILNVSSICAANCPMLVPRRKLQ